MKGCQSQFYYGTNRYPDYRCIDGSLWDDDNCDDNGNLYKPLEFIACPFCNPTHFDEEELAYMKSIEYNNYKENI